MIDWIFIICIFFLKLFYITCRRKSFELLSKDIRASLCVVVVVLRMALRCRCGELFVERN